VELVHAIYYIRLWDWLYYTSYNGVCFFHVQITVASYNGQDGLERLNKFNIEVIERMTEYPWYNNYSQINSIKVREIIMPDYKPRSLRIHLVIFNYIPVYLNQALS